MASDAGQTKLLLA